MKTGPFAGIDLEDLAARGIAAASYRLQESLATLRASGGEAAKIGEGCLKRSTDAFKAMATGQIDPDIGREVIAREIDATAELAKGLAHAGARELADFVIVARKTLLEVGVPLLKIVLSSVV